VVVVPDVGGWDAVTEVGVGIGERYPRLRGFPPSLDWLRLLSDLGRAPRTIDAYARGVSDYLDYCGRAGFDLVAASRADVAGYLRDLRERPAPAGANVIALDSGAGLSNATLQLRLTVIRLLYDYLSEEGMVARSPVPRGRPAGADRRRQGGLVSFHKLPWIPTDAQWAALLAAAATEPVRNRLMLAVAYDAALRREELCLLDTDDIDPAQRMLTIRAETTKTRRGRVVPYSVPTGVLLQRYLAHRRTITTVRGALFVSESHRNRGEPISPWTWSKVVRAIALRAGVPGFSTHTLRHLCLTDLARAGWELHEIATFAGHRNTQTTSQYIHLSGRDLAAKLENGMTQIHADRVRDLGDDLR
jgi:integrase/recombinase XerD